MTRPTLTELFAQRQFMFFWLARLAGVLAQQMLMVALAWQMYDITGSAWDLGLVGLFQFVPALLLTLPAGHLVDRWRRGRIFAVCMLVQASVALLLVGGTQGGFMSRELILLLSVVLGAARAFQMPTQQALIPMLVPVHLLERAVTLGSTGMQAAVICGPALGGLLYVGGATVVYAASAGLLMVAFSLMFGVHEAHQPSTEPPGLRSILAGVEFVWNNKLLLGATSLDLFAVLLGGATALLPIFARDILHVGRKVWACCAPPRQSGPCSCRWPCCAGRFSAGSVAGCLVRSAYSGWRRWFSACRIRSGCRSARWCSAERPITSAS